MPRVNVSTMPMTCSAMIGPPMRCMLVTRMSRSRTPGIATQFSTPAVTSWIQRIDLPAATSSGVQKPIATSALAACLAISSRLATTISTPGATGCNCSTMPGIPLRTRMRFGLRQPGRSLTGVAACSSP